MRERDLRKFGKFVNLERIIISNVKFLTYAPTCTVFCYFSKL